MKHLLLIILSLFVITLNCNAQNKAQTIVYFEGTRKFCDEFWYYLVSINKNKIILKCYPGLKNTAHKNKRTPFHITKGIIKNGKFFTKGEDGSFPSLYRFENNNLIEICAENTESIYHLCK